MRFIFDFLRLIRFPNLIIIGLTQYAIRFGIIYPFLKQAELDLFLSEGLFALLVGATVLIAASGYIINDYFDVKVDRVNRPDKIIVGKYIKRRVAMGAHIVINSIAITLGAYLAYKVDNWNLIFIQILSAGALWYYSTKFKKQVIIGNVIVALLAALVPLVSGLYEIILQYNFSDDTINMLLFRLEEYTPFEQIEYLLFEVLKHIMYWVVGFSVFAFLATMVREIIKDIEDYDGDKKYLSNTLAVVYGKNKAKVTAQSLIIVMVLMIGYFQYMQIEENPGGEDASLAKAQTRALITVMYLLFTVQIPLLFVVYKLKIASLKPEFHTLSVNVKLIMLTGITYIGLFYYLIMKL